MDVLQTAFAHYLRQQPLEQARAYLLECLSAGSADSLAWALWESVHGQATTGPGGVQATLDACLKAIEHPAFTAGPGKES